MSDSQTPTTVSKKAQTPDEGEPDNRSGMLVDSPGVQRLKGRTELRTASLHLAESARRELVILTRDLDPSLYDSQPFLDALKRLALENPRRPVRILVFDPGLPVRYGHRLIGLARRLPSRIAIRRLAEPFRERTEAFLIADGQACCLRPRADELEALLVRPADARRLHAGFQQMWGLSEEDLELHHLNL